MIQDIYPHKLDNQFHPGTPIAEDDSYMGLRGSSVPVYAKTLEGDWIPTGDSLVYVDIAEDSPDTVETVFVYVRPTPKDHGTRSQIEGVLPVGSKVVVIEDLVSTGKSSLMAVRALRDAGAEVLGMVAIFTYAFPEAEAAFAGEGVRLVTLSNYPALVRAAIDGGRLSPETEKTLGEWRENPSVWKQE